MDKKVKNPDEILLDLCQAFNKHSAEYVLVGGFAMIIHGFNRTTSDIDFFVNPEPQNVDKIKKALLEVFQDTSINEIESHDISEYAVIRYGTPYDFYIDFIGQLGESITWNDVKDDVEIFEIEKTEIRVCGIQNLIKMKQTVRLKDRMDLEFLKQKNEHC
jgi:hypothetical protein